MLCLHILAVLMIIHGCTASATSLLQSAIGRVKGGLIQGPLGRQVSCAPNSSPCQDGTCCPIGGECCVQNTCCDAGSHCYLGTNGIEGCCANGKICSGPVPGDLGSPSPSPTVTSAGSSTSLPSAPNFFAPQSPPVPFPGYVNVFIPSTDDSITWSSDGWTDSTSTCNSTQICRKTQTGQSSFTYITSPDQSGGVVYMAASFGSTNIDMLPKVMIFFNGEEYYSEYGLIDCDYNFIDFLLYLDGKTSSNLTVVIGDPLLTQSDASWSFEFNGLMIGQSTATSTSQGFPESTNTGASVGGSSATTSISQSFGFTVAVAVVMLAFYF